MALLDFLKGRRQLNSLLAAGALMTGALSVRAAEGEEKTPPAQTQSVIFPNLDRINTFIEKTDEICRKLVMNDLKEREGSIAHLYLDSRGILTTGNGLNVNDYKSFSQLDFKDANGVSFNDKQKRAYYAQVMNFKKEQAKKGFNFKASYYANRFAYRPTAESLQTMFLARVNNSIEEVKKQAGHESYYNAHVRIQAEMVMLHYNMGGSRFNRKKFPKFFAALDAGNYQEMAKQSHIAGVSEERNKLVAQNLAADTNSNWPNVGTQYKQAVRTEQMRLAMVNNAR